MRGLKARTNFVYPTHETCLLSAAAALAAPNGLQHSAQHHEVDLIAQKTLGEVLLLSAAKMPRNFDWHSTCTSQLSYDEHPRSVFNRPASMQKHQLVDEYRLPGHGCRYVDRKIQPASVPMRPLSPDRMLGVPQQLQYDNSSMQPEEKQHHQHRHALTSPLINKAEVEGFRVSPGRREQWHCVPSEPDQQFRHLSQFERSPIVITELFVSRYCGAGSQPFQVCEQRDSSFKLCEPSHDASQSDLTKLSSSRGEVLHCRIIVLRVNELLTIVPCDTWGRSLTATTCQWLRRTYPCSADQMARAAKCPPQLPPRSGRSRQRREDMGLSIRWCPCTLTPRVPAR